MKRAQTDFKIAQTYFEREKCRREELLLDFPGFPLLGLDPEVGQRHDFVVDLHVLGRGAGAAAVQEACGARKAS